MTYPVRYHVVRPARFTRLQLAIRVVAFCALGVLGLSFGAVFVFAYLALAAFAAARMATGEPAAYLADDGPHIERGLRWLAAICAWTGLVVDRLPAGASDPTIELTIERTGHPTAAGALWRILTGLPSALVLAFLCCIGSLVWLWAAISILVTEHVGPHAFAYLVGLQRWSVRLLAYQASLVDEYPPFSFSDAPPSAAHAVEAS